MKRRIKGVLKAVWRSTLPVRRPLMRWFEGVVARSIRPTEAMLVEEARILMEHVVRELVRLQRQVDSLEDAVGDLASPVVESPGGVVGSPDGRLKAG